MSWAISSILYIKTNDYNTFYFSCPKHNDKVESGAAPITFPVEVGVITLLGHECLEQADDSCLDISVQFVFELHEQLFAC